MQKSQNRAMRLIIGCDRYTSTKYMLDMLNCMSVKYFLEYNALDFIHKIRSGLTPKYLQNIVQTFEELHGYNTRGRENFVLQRVRSAAGQNSIFSKGISKYNRLDQIIKATESIISFKRLLKQTYV